MNSPLAGLGAPAARFGLNIPTELELRMRVVRRSEPIDAFGDGFTAVYEDDELRDRVLIVGPAGETVDALDAYVFWQLQPLIQRPEPGAMLRELREELSKAPPLKLAAVATPAAAPINRRERRAAAARARKGKL